MSSWVMPNLDEVEATFPAFAGFREDFLTCLNGDVTRAEAMWQSGLTDSRAVIATQGGLEELDVAWGTAVNHFIKLIWPICLEKLAARAVDVAPRARLAARPLVRIKPESFADAQRIGDLIVAGTAVLLDLGGVNRSTAQRLADFAYGVAQASGASVAIEDGGLYIEPQGEQGGPE